MFLPKTMERLFGRIVRYLAGVDEKKLYGLDHAILNIEVPPRCMWMNMGYWKDTDRFPEACESLLDQVLITAGLQGNHPSSESGVGDSSVNETRCKQSIKLVDVGIGCGDQTIYLTRNLTRPAAAAEGPNSKESELRPLFDSYVGITIAPPQAEFAKERVRKIDDASTGDAQGRSTPETNIFAADAADPASWDPELQQAAFGDAERSNGAAGHEAEETWLLALDTLYHFKPSRTPLLKRACRDMCASFMAFDLLISEHASFLDKLILRLMCLVTGIPFSNFLRREQYEDMLVDAGYERHMIEMRDISEHVFGGIAGYIWRKDRELRRYGMDMGKFRGPAKVFDWWARSGLVRGFIVVARLSRRTESD